MIDDWRYQMDNVIVVDYTRMSNTMSEQTKPIMVQK